jgi:hypothetical protein
MKWLRKWKSSGPFEYAGGQLSTSTGWLSRFQWDICRLTLCWFRLRMIDTLSRQTMESRSKCLLRMKLLIMEVYFIKNLYFLLTCSMGESPPRAGRLFSASQEILRILWNLKVHYRVNKCPSPVRILGHLDPVHVPPSLFRKIHLNIIFLFTTESSQWSPSSGSPTKTLYITFLSPMYATYPAYLILIDFITRTILGEV